MSLYTYLDFGMLDNLGHLGIVEERGALLWKPNLHRELGVDAVGNEIVQGLTDQQWHGGFRDDSNHSPCP